MVVKDCNKISKHNYIILTQRQQVVTAVGDAVYHYPAMTSPGQTGVSMNLPGTHLCRSYNIDYCGTPSAAWNLKLSGRLWQYHLPSVGISDHLTVDIKSEIILSVPSPTHTLNSGLTQQAKF